MENSENIADGGAERLEELEEQKTFWDSMSPRNEREATSIILQNMTARIRREK